MPPPFHSADQHETSGLVSLTDLDSAQTRAADLLDKVLWQDTPLGMRETWPSALNALVRVVLASPVAMTLLVGRSGVMIYNDGYAVIAGKRHPDCFGTPATQSWPEVADFNRRIIDGVFEGQCFSYADTEMTLQRNGSPETVWLNLDYSPVFDDHGDVIAVLAVVVETTKAVESRQALARNREKLSLALDISGIVGIWDWDVLTDRVVADRKFAAIYGVDPDVAAVGAPISAFTSAVHPDDAGRIAQAIQHAMNTGEKFSQEYRLLQKDASVRWVLAEGQAVTENGLCSRFPGIAIDITAQKAAAEAFARSEAGFRTLADTMPQMVWSTRPDGFHDYYNARWYEFTGMPAGSTDGEAWNGMFHVEDQDRAWSSWRHSLQTGDPYQIEYRLRHHSGVYRWVLGRALPIRDEAGAISRWYGTCTDIHDARMAQAEREVVAHELSHRIKNIFSVLSGIISLSARSEPQARGFAEQLRRRIEAMGRAHDFVRPHSETSRATQPETTLFNLVKRLLEPYWGNGTNSPISLSGEDTPIADGAATPLALLLHELGTNAAKYGALSKADGQIVITGSSDGPDYRLTWQEIVPDADIRPPQGEGFGSRLMTISAEGQLEGSLEKRWEADGLRVDITVPRSSLARSGRLGR